MSSKARRREKRHEARGRLYAEEGEARDWLTHPAELRAYDMRKKELADEHARKIRERDRLMELLGYGQ